MIFSEPDSAKPEVLDLQQFIPSPQACASMDQACAQRLHVVPIALLAGDDGQVLLVATSSSNDFTQRERLRKHVLPSIQIRWCLVASDQISQALQRCYGRTYSEQELLIVCQNEEASKRAAQEDENYFIGLLECILRSASRHNASDIHFSPGPQLVRVRFRLDGVLHDFLNLHSVAYVGLLVRLKVISSMDIAESRLPQDGQFQQLIDGVEVNFRVSTFPAQTGENTVLRLIGDHTRLRCLADLNLDADVQQALERVAARPDGLIVVCGPTGSGKSTTLFALLAEKDKHGLNIMTLEDPVEQVVAGVTQTGMDDSRMWGYSQALRAVLRQDPDVLLVGEVRDHESCVMALRAVMTGHQVFTTVHSNNAHGALARLLELGAQPGALASGLSMVMSQRLLRLSCKFCTSDNSRANQDCGHCHGTGFEGRQVIVETLLITAELAECLSRRESMSKIEALSREQGFVSLEEQALELIETGRVSNTEVFRVLGIAGKEPNPQSGQL